jgi:hypothetical protein
MKNDDFIQVFIIRIWRERTEKPNLTPKWKGVIEHLQSKKRVYIKDLSKISNFITPYLEEMGVIRDNQEPGGNIFKRIADCLRGIRRNE